MICLALFDPTVTLEVKREMLSAIKSGPPGNINPPKRITIMGDLSEKRKQTSSATQQSIKFFTTVNLRIDFLQVDPHQWCYNSEYKTALKYVQASKVVNDTAERGVALIQEFNADLTRKDDQKQFLLQVVAEHRRLFPDSKKSIAVAGLKC